VDAASSSDGVLDSVLVLETGDAPRIDWFSPAERVIQLMANAYCVEALLENHTPILFERMTALARKIRVGRFSRPVSWTSLSEISDWLMNYPFR
jgi:hypothetical protein